LQIPQIFLRFWRGNLVLSGTGLMRPVMKARSGGFRLGNARTQNETA
jgi:hypothetical protein